MSLEHYQMDAVNKLMLRKSGILIAGCGAGKTYMATEIIKRRLPKNTNLNYQNWGL